jgi:antitoxin VapB
MSTAKLFMIGGSQAVRIPRNMRLAGESVSIRKVGTALVIEPINKDGWAWLDTIDPLDPTFMADGRKQNKQKRPALDTLFS